MAFTGSSTDLLGFHVCLTALVNWALGSAGKKKIL